MNRHFFKQWFLPDMEQNEEALRELVVQADKKLYAMKRSPLRQSVSRI